MSSFVEFLVKYVTSTGRSELSLLVAFVAAADVGHFTRTDLGHLSGRPPVLYPLNKLRVSPVHKEHVAQWNHS